MTERGAVFVISSGKGGVGKSVFAANLALALRWETGGSVALLDMNDEFCGDSAHAAGVSPYILGDSSGVSPGANKGIIELVSNVQNISSKVLLSSIPQTSSGVSVLNLKGDGEENRAVPYENVGPFIELVARSYKLVVIDLCAGYSSIINKICFERANGIFVLFRPELFDIFNSIRSFSLLQQMMFPKQMIYPVLNMYSVRDEFPVSMIEAKIERDVFAAIPRDDLFFSTALRLNKIAIDIQRGHPVTKAFNALSAKLWAMDLCSSKKVDMNIELIPNEVVESSSLTESSSSTLSTSKNDEDNFTGISGKYDEVKIRIHRRLFEELDLKVLDEKAMESEAARRGVREKVKAVIDRLVDEEVEDFIDREERILIAKEVMDEAMGLGPIEDFLHDESVTEIMCNGADSIFLEKNGKLYKSERRFLDERYLRSTVERIVMRIGRRIDELSPMVDARLEDGSRVNAVVPPLSPDGCLLTIRKFSKDPLSMQDLIDFGSLNDHMAKLLRLCVEAKLNILISGGTGSGKTTLLNVLSGFVPERERIVTIEDATELQLQQEHVCRLESKPANIEGRGEVTIRDLVRNSLRMRPDRIIVGECRGAEAVDMLQAMNTGHDGSMTTIHANRVEDAVSRLETLVMFAGLELPSKAIKEQIASAINIVIQQNRQLDGTRKITKISELTGMEGNVVTTQEIFSFHQTGRDDSGNIVGEFRASGLIPNFIAELERRGFDVPREIFV